MWLGPPYMYRKITLRAFAGRCGFFGARGLTKGTGAPAARERKKSSPRSPARATPVKPQPACQRNSRRVRPQKLPVMSSPSSSPDSPMSVQINELVDVQGQQAEAGQGLLRGQTVLVSGRGQESDAAVHLGRRRRPLPDAPQGPAHLGGGVAAGLLAQVVGEERGL